LREMNEKKLSRMMEKAETLVGANNVKKVFYSPLLEEVCQIDNSDEVRKAKKRIFEKWVYPCVIENSEKCGINLMDGKVCIRSDNPEKISEVLIQKFCLETKRLSLCTGNRKKAQVICEKLLENYGMTPAVVSKAESESVDVLIDADEGFVRIGRNLTIDGVAMDMDLHGFSIDPVAITAYIGDFAVTDRKISYFSGKKKLTL